MTAKKPSLPRSHLTAVWGRVVLAHECADHGDAREAYGRAQGQIEAFKDCHAAVENAYEEYGPRSKDDYSEGYLDGLDTAEQLISALIKAEPK